MTRQTAHDAGFTLIELIIALALASIVMALVGSLFIASLSVWRRGNDIREAQAQATGLVDAIARDIRSASQAPSVTVRPRLAVPDGQPLLAMTTTQGAAAGVGAAWIVYTQNQERREVLRLMVEVDQTGRVLPRETRLMAIGVEEVTVEETGGGITIQVAVRRGKELATSRATASPRNP